MIWSLPVLMLAGCGGGPGQEGPSRGPEPSASGSQPASTAASTPGRTPSSGPRGGGRGIDDVNADGYADLVIEVGVSERRQLAVLYGSSRGLDPGRRTVVPPGTFSSWLVGGGIRGDFDGDGFGDVVAHGARAGDDAPQGPHLLWGGPAGIAARTPPTPVRPAAGSEPAHSRAVAGDFDTDGHADLALSGPPQADASAADLTVLYGPFTRQGVPARRTVQPSPTGSEFWRMTSDDLGGRRGGGLLVHEGDDGEQTSPWLLAAGPGGLAKTGRKLNAGMSAAFGDFDGDGARDVAVGDDGSRNNEPGYETEPPSVDKTVTVYHRNGRQAAFRGTAGAAVAGDFDGDGRDDLAFGGAGRQGPPRAYSAPKVFRGGPGGLGAGRHVEGPGKVAPLAAGDYDGDGDDELVLAAGDDDAPAIVLTDGTKLLTSFPTSTLAS